MRLGSRRSRGSTARLGARFVRDGNSTEGMQLNVAGRIGSRYDLLTSSNLVGWVPWCSVTKTARIMTITDPVTGTCRQRFYRSVQP